MTHTTIVTPETQRINAENIRNECKRHCRIGKVRRKLASGHGQIEVYWPTPLDLPRAIAPDRRKCSCPPGTVCGSVACPHLPVVTC